MPNNRCECFSTNSSYLQQRHRKHIYSLLTIAVWLKHVLEEGKCPTLKIELHLHFPCTFLWFYTDEWHVCWTPVWISPAVKNLTSRKLNLGWQGLTRHCIRVLQARLPRWRLVKGSPSLLLLQQHWPFNHTGVTNITDQVTCALSLPLSSCLTLFNCPSVSHLPQWLRLFLSVWPAHCLHCFSSCSCLCVLALHCCVSWPLCCPVFSY